MLDGVVRHSGHLCITASLITCGTLFVTGCDVAGPNSVFRQNPLVRAVAYPRSANAGQEPLQRDDKGLTFDHSVFGHLLSSVVHPDGTVAYGRVLRDPESLSMYLETLPSAPYADLSSNEQLAFLLNAYNAFTLQLMIEHPQAESIRDIPASKRWKDERWALAGRTVSLDQLEHDWIRPTFRDPHVHFALVCASTGCPPLREQPYVGARLQSQLADQARRFFLQSRNLEWDPSRRRLAVSELLDWFAGDFGQTHGELVAFIANYAPDPIGGEIRAISDVRLRFLAYDWSLNGDWR